MCYQVLIQTIDGVINFKIYLGSSSKIMSNGEKRGENRKCNKYEYLENEKSFLDEIKYIFHN